MNERMDPLIQPSHSRFFAKPSIGKMIKENPVLGANPFYAGMLSGMAAGCVSASAIYPLDVVRLRLTTTPGLYKGVLDGFRTIAAKEGTAALFKGIAYANLWAIPYTGALFATAVSSNPSTNSNKAPDRRTDGRTDGNREGAGGLPACE